MPRVPLKKTRHPDDGATVVIGRDEILVRHPGYTVSVPLLILPAHDRSSHNGKGAFHHGTLRIGCAAIACNRYDGFLTTDRDGLVPLADDPDMEVNAGEYWFQVPKFENAPRASPGVVIEVDPEYPVFPNARHWQFSGLPDYWSRVSIDLSQIPPPREIGFKDGVRDRDKSCRMTLTIARGEAAHLVPQNMRDWFDLRGMSVYDDFDSPSNGILLRPDVHQTLDLQHFAFIVRTVLGPSGEPESRIFAYVFRRDCLPEVAETYHDVETQPISGIRPEFLFCRFVITLFEAVGPFMRQGLQRWLKINVRGNEYETKLCSPTESRVYGTRSRSRPSSPQKRPLAEPSGDENRDADTHGTERKRSYSTSSDDSNDWGSPRRGRERKRRFSSGDSSSFTSASTAPDPFDALNCTSEDKLNKQNPSQAAKAVEGTFE